MEENDRNQPPEELRSSTDARPQAVAEASPGSAPGAEPGYLRTAILGVIIILLLLCAFTLFMAYRRQSGQQAPATPAPAPAAATSAVAGSPSAPASPATPASPLASPAGQVPGGITPGTGASVQPPALAPGAARPVDLAFNDLLYGIVLLDGSKTPLTADQASRIELIMDGRLPGLRKGLSILNQTALLLTPAQKTWLEKRFKKFSPLGKELKGRFLGNLRKLAPSAGPGSLAFPAELPEGKAPVPYLNVLILNFDALQKEPTVRLTEEQAGKLVPWCLAYIETPVTVEESLLEVLDEPQKKYIMDNLGLNNGKKPEMNELVKQLKACLAKRRG